MALLSIDRNNLSLLDDHTNQLPFDALVKMTSCSLSFIIVSMAIQALAHEACITASTVQGPPNDETSSTETR